MANRVDSMVVHEFIKSRGITSTLQVATKFKIKPTQAAANLAILRIKGLIVPAEKPATGKDQSSRWVCC